MSHDYKNDVDVRAADAMAELVRMFSGPPQRKGKDRYQHLQYIPIERDGIIEFIRDPFDVEMDQMFAEILDQLFGPDPAEDVEVDLG